jgi:NAD(P)H dehydrogenase (quinone)
VSNEFQRKQRIVVIGGGPGGYDAALAAAQLGADVTLIERSGIGGSAVMTDVVPSKSLIATAEAVSAVKDADKLGVQIFITDDKGAPRKAQVAVNLEAINKRLLKMAMAQSEDMAETLSNEGVRVIVGHGRLEGPNAVVVSSAENDPSTDFEHLDADTIVVAVGASPRILDTAQPDGERILTWKQVYDLKSVPEHLIVVGSGVTGAEFASAYRSLGAEVTLVSSRDQVLPGEDADAAKVIQGVFKRSGMTLLNKARAKAVTRDGDTVTVHLEDGQTVTGSHCLLAVGAIPNTANLGLEKAGVQTNDSGHIIVNRVARTSVPSIYAAGDCTNFWPLASVATMQGRAAIFHSLGEMVQPINERNIAANIFTQPEIATVGIDETDIEQGKLVTKAVTYKLPLKTNARAKMMGIKDGFVKIFASQGSGVVLGGVIVAPKASELIFPLALAVEHRLTVDQVASAFAVYPSLVGSIPDVARAMHVR